MKRDTRISFRINTDDLMLFQKACEVISSTVSEVLRGYISEVISPYKKKVVAELVRKDSEGEL